MERPSSPNPQFLTRSGDAFPTKVIDTLGGAVVPGSQIYPFLGPPEEPDEIGRLGNYRVFGLLGMGGMGMVFRAEDMTLRRPVALKVMKPGLGSGQGSAWQRFLREARAMAATNHEHVVTVYQVGQEGDLIFLAMELLEGEMLDTWCQRIARPPLVDILRIGRETALGLAAIHQRGLIHRDIKPSNIWLETKVEGGGMKAETPGRATGPAFILHPASFRVKILDFGLALDTHENTHLTQTGTILGTPAYLSPEQARGKATDARTDLFSLGCVLYRLCTGTVPFPAANTLDQLAALAADEPTPVQQLNGAIPLMFANFVMELLAKKPEERPQSALEVAHRLRDIEGALRARGNLGPDPTEPIAVPAVIKRRPAAAPGWWRRHARWIALAPLGIVVLGLATLGVISLFDRPPRAEEATFLTDLPKLHTVNWPFHKVDKEKGKGKGVPPELFEPITVKGELAPHGIFMHPAPPHQEPASITVHLNRQYRTFAARVSLNDSGPEAPSSMTFAVYGDGRLLWKSKEIDFQEQTEACKLDIKNVGLLKLEVTARGDVKRAHAVWLDPTVTK